MSMPPVYLGRTLDTALRFPSRPSPVAMQTVLTIAGFDPSSGAGISADLMVFAAHGLFGTACITGLTVQSTVGVRPAHPVEASVVGATLDCLQEDLPPVGIKIGMLSSSNNIRVISSYIEKLRLTDRDISGHVIIVLDPVLRSSSGRELVDYAGVELLRERLFPLVDWVTPNIEELAILSDLKIAGRDDLPAACWTLQNRTAQLPGGRLGIVATGGHLDPPDDFLLTPSGEEIWLPGERVETRSTHGTGCAFSSAFLSRLVLGDSPADAARGAKLYVAEAMRTAVGRGLGNGPLNHLWPFDQPNIEVSDAAERSAG